MMSQYFFENIKLSIIKSYNYVAIGYLCSLKNGVWFFLL